MPTSPQGANFNSNAEDFGKMIANGFEKFVGMGQSIITDTVITGVNENIKKIPVGENISSVQISHSIISPLMSALGYSFYNLDLSEMTLGANGIVIATIKKNTEAQPIVMEIRPLVSTIEGVSGEVTNVAEKVGTERIIITNGKFIKSVAITKTNNIVSLCEYDMDTITAEELAQVVDGIQEKTDDNENKEAGNPFINTCENFDFEELKEKAQNNLDNLKEQINEAYEYVNQKAEDFADNYNIDLLKSQIKTNDFENAVKSNIPIAESADSSVDENIPMNQDNDKVPLTPPWRKKLYCEDEMFFIIDPVIDDSIAVAKVEDGYLSVLAGSRFMPFADPKLPQSAQRVRDAFMDECDRNECELTDDIYCWKSHPSAVASAIMGERTNGWDIWVNEHGNTIEERSKACYEAEMSVLF